MAVQFCAEHGLQDELAWPLTAAFSGERTKTIGDLYSKYALWLMNDDDPFLEDLVFFLVIFHSHVTFSEGNIVI